jgi:hypothetical protein
MATIHELQQQADALREQARAIDAQIKELQHPLKVGQIWLNVETEEMFVAHGHGVAGFITLGSIYGDDNKPRTSYGPGFLLKHPFVYVGLARDVLRVVGAEAIAQPLPEPPS